MKAIILHGTQGSPESNWFRWLEQALKQRGWHVWVPGLPNPEQPSLRDSSAFLISKAPFAIDDQTVLIGHSSGATVALIVAQQLDTPVKGTLCVSTVKDNDFLQWSANDRLIDVSFDFAAIRAHAGKLTFVHGDDDPYVPLAHAAYLAEQTGGELTVLPGQGHFNLEKSPEYKQFPALLDLILERFAA